MLTLNITAKAVAGTTAPATNRSECGSPRSAVGDSEPHLPQKGKLPHELSKLSNTLPKEWQAHQQSAAVEIPRLQT